MQSFENEYFTNIELKERINLQEGIEQLSIKSEDVNIIGNEEIIREEVLIDITETLTSPNSLPERYLQPEEEVKEDIMLVNEDEYVLTKCCNKEVLKKDYRDSIMSICSYEKTQINAGSIFIYIYV